MKPIAQEVLDDIFNELRERKVLSNLTRPLFVEKLLVRLLGADWQHVGGDWSGWDLENTKSHLRIEVKQSASRQTWTDGPARIGSPTKPVFDIRERTGYFGDGGSKWIALAGRPADLYIFAWHPHFSPAQSVDHKDPDQWEFYVLPERSLPRSQKTIGLSSLRKLNPDTATSRNLATTVEQRSADLLPLKWTQVPQAAPTRS